MSDEAVDIYVKAHNELGDPISAVTVKVFSEDGTAVHGQAATDVDGKASFLLPAPATYQVRFYKFGTTFTNPQLIEIEEGASAAFNVYGEPFVHGQSTDARLCTVSGYFRTPSGAPAKHLDMHFIAKFDPILLEGAGVVTERVHTRTDENGFASLRLIRFAQYDVTIEGFEDISRTVSVPDSPYVNLPDLLFPVVSGFTFDEATPISMSVGDELEIHPHVWTTDLRELEQLGSDVSWSLSDTTILTMEVRQRSILLRALAPGSSELRAARVGPQLTIVRIPNTELTGAPLTVTIT